MSAWCTQTELEDLISANGLNNSTNDNQTNLVSDPTIVANAIERGQERLGQYLAAKYDVTTITSANKWIKWATAAFAAVEIYRRKGGTVPPGVQEIYEEYVQRLDGIENGSGLVPGLSTRSSPGISVSNVMVDNSYNRAKIRKVDSISYPVGLNKVASFHDRLDNGSSY